LEITRDGLRKYPGGYDYYCQKRDEFLSKEKQSAKPDVKESVKEQNEAVKLTSKELRRQRAAERALIAPKVKELKKCIELSERKISELELKLEEASAELFNPTPNTDFAEVNRLVRTLQFEIDRYTADWEKASLELEELTKVD
jgi:ATPase subunit of ABC transporter with duplicated ATPase domains